MKSNSIAIIGLGYVGLPLAYEFCKCGYNVYGYDIDQSRIDELNSNFDRTLEIDEIDLKNISNKLKYTSLLTDLSYCNIYIITVPTPITKENKPDLTPLINASKAVGSILSINNIVIYESTVYPGVTEDICVPILENKSKLQFNKDFYCGYSPERINPGDKKNTLKNILKVTSGSTPKIATIVDDLYKSIITAGTHKCSSIKIAEASKVIENTQRDVNIALINELALIFDNMNIDTQEVLEASSTKWNFINMKPGLVGGHCIGVDPYYLTYKAQELGYKPNLILNARQINNSIGKYIADKTIKFMIKKEKVIKNSNILILGFTFKENCPDTRNTKVIDIIDELQDFEINIDVYDPWIDKDNSDYHFISSPFDKSKKYEAIIVAVGHDIFKNISTRQYDKISTKNKILIDVKGIVDNYTWRL